MTQVYFDHNATTKVDDAVLAAMLPYFREHYGNASSSHSLGLAARRAIDQAREQVAQAVGARPAQVIFTSGGSEANNLFIRGVADSLKPSALIVSAIEHPCVMRTAQALTRKNGEKWQLHYLSVDAAGQVNTDEATEMLVAEKPAMVSVMLANNETGVIQDVTSIAEAAKTQGTWMHTDAVQAFGKVPVNFDELGIHAMTLSAHKIYGPKGAAALIIDERLPLKPLIYGGGHEDGLRSGTENVPAIVGFGAACELAISRLTESMAHTVKLRDHLEHGLLAMGATVFGLDASRLPNTCYFALPDIEGDTLVVRLDKRGFAVASGAACSSAVPGKSHVLEAMNVPTILARCAVRASLGPDNTIEEVDAFLSAIRHIADELRKMSVLLNV
ncbi:cysteine desulfurase family protein [Nitrosomonas eutropha]|uniref:cysteine desulfurase n=2 Tax=Nitrosomonas eutropha TaxID=916 RepID=A0ABX5M7Z4_9PROT|nr:cysteine desulfurase family protein [Nitrosomonas eutropha]ABI58553.1 aminotransferase, class V [Nitrosomonas eutropha C91]PXV82348.1 cysteine desulfurase [Nitrosomonas eutropha]SEI67721.1 cysteine desulfurase [Nitrosomonas eutropha]